MKRYIMITQLPIIAVALLVISIQWNKNEKKEVATTKPVTSPYTITKIDTVNIQPSQLVYNPMNDTLTAVLSQKRRYSLSVWTSESHWTANVACWKVKKNQKLDNFSYNTNGALYACLKEYKKECLYHQTLVRLRGNGKIEKIKLTKLNQLENKKKSTPTEITDIQCDGTSIAITYRHGAMKIYNLSEGQALGASHISGTPQNNVFYKWHYLTVKESEKNNAVFLYDYDARIGCIHQTFSLGSREKKESSFQLSHYQDDLYVLTPKGIFLGNTDETQLTKYMDYHDLPIHSDEYITYMQAARNQTIYIGTKSSTDSFCLQQFILSDISTKRPTAKRKNI